MATSALFEWHLSMFKLKNKNKEADYYEQQTPKQNSKYRVE